MADRSVGDNPERQPGFGCRPEVMSRRVRRVSACRGARKGLPSRRDGVGAPRQPGGSPVTGPRASRPTQPQDPLPHHPPAPGPPTGPTCLTAPERRGLPHPGSSSRPPRPASARLGPPPNDGPLGQPLEGRCLIFINASGCIRNQYQAKSRPLTGPGRPQPIEDRPGAHRARPPPPPPPCPPRASTGRHRGCPGSPPTTLRSNGPRGTVEGCRI
jgi:hypothetical protein